MLRRIRSKIKYLLTSTQLENPAWNFEGIKKYLRLLFRNCEWRHYEGRDLQKAIIYRTQFCKFCYKFVQDKSFPDMAPGKLCCGCLLLVKVLQTLGACVCIPAIYIYIYRPASWSSGQGLWLLTMKSLVRFPVIPWEFFLAGKDSRGDHGLGS